MVASPPQLTVFKVVRLSAPAGSSPAMGITQGLFVINLFSAKLIYVYTLNQTIEAHTTMTDIQHLYYY